MENIELEKLVTKANEQIQRIKDWYSEHSAAFNYMDLKLHDVSFYCYEGMKEDFPLCYKNDGKGEDSYFYTFCEIEYDSFVEDLKENFGIDFKDYRFQLGRTSSFYLHDQNIFSVRGYRIEWEYTIYDILYWHSGYVCTTCDKDGKIDLNKTLTEFKEADINNEETMKRFVEELNWLTTEMYDEVTKHFEDMLKVYEYIKDFKDNQVENFKEWLQYYEDELAEEKRQAEEHEAKRQTLIARFKNNVLREILNKYVTSNEEIEKLLNAM